MTGMNDQIRRAVRVRLAERDLKQGDLAQLVGMKPQYISRLMTGDIGRIPEAWLKVLGALDLELVAMPKKAAAEP